MKAVYFSNDVGHDMDSPAAPNKTQLRKFTFIVNHHTGKLGSCLKREPDIGVYFKAIEDAKTNRARAKVISRWPRSATGTKKHRIQQHHAKKWARFTLVHTK